MSKPYGATVAELSDWMWPRKLSSPEVSSRVTLSLESETTSHAVEKGMFLFRLLASVNAQPLWLLHFTAKEDVLWLSWQQLGEAVDDEARR